jgi:hypothetical protein
MNKSKIGLLLFLGFFWVMNRTAVAATAPAPTAAQSPEVPEATQPPAEALKNDGPLPTPEVSPTAPIPNVPNSDASNPSLSIPDVSDTAIPQASSQAPAPISKPALQLLTFQFSQVSAFRGAGDTFSGFFSWNPSYRLCDYFGLSTHLGGSIFSGGTNVPNFGVAEYEILAQFYLPPFLFEIGGGGQSWLLNQIQNYGNVSFYAHYQFEPRFLWIVDSIFAGETVLFLPGLVHEIQVGIRIAF